MLIVSLHSSLLKESLEDRIEIKTGILKECLEIIMDEDSSNPTITLVVATRVATTLKESFSDEEKDFIKKNIALSGLSMN
jgi:hypothetical protein